jgi:hypothetical protein
MTQPPPGRHRPDIRRPGRRSRTAAVAAVAAIATIAATVLAAVIGAAPAMADNVQAAVVAGGSTTFAVGGSSTLTYSLQATNGDGANGCNASTFRPVTVAVGTPTGLTATPSSVSFTSCTVTRTVVFTASTAGSYQVTASVSGGQGSFATTSARPTFTVTGAADSTGPVISGLPTNQTLEATSAAGAPLGWTATAFDAGDNASRPVSCAPATGATFPIGTTTVTCTSADSKGNTSAASFTVTVRDTTGPVLALTDRTVEALGPDGAPVSYAPSATDAVDGNRPVSCVPASGGTFGLGSTTVTCTAGDTRGNTSTGTFAIHVADTVAPTLTLSDATAEATDGAGANVSYAATATDLISGAAAVTCDKPGGSYFGAGDTLVTCQATDAAGNTATGTLHVMVSDRVAPVLSLSDLAADATWSGGAAVVFAPPPTAVDAADGAVPVSCDATSGSTFAIGASTVSCTATDRNGNIATGTFTVAVQDTSAPALTLTDQVAEATGPAGAAVTFDPAPTAQDLIDGPITPTCTPSTGATLPIGVSTVTCTATDAAGNTATGTFTVTVRDTTGPQLTLPDTVNAEASGPGGAIVAWTATASDLVSGDLPVSCSPAAGSQIALGLFDVTCTATDAAGNVATGTFDGAVLDTTPPAFDVFDLTVEATDATGADVTFPLTATDAVDGPVPATCDAAPGHFGVGQTLVTCLVADAAGNTLTSAFVIDVVDTTPPALSLTDLVLEATGPSGAPVDWRNSVSAVDLVSGIVPVTCNLAPGTVVAIGTTSLTCTATDAAGNIATGTLTVSVRDTVAPQLTLTDRTVEATGPTGAEVSWTATAVDLVSGSLPVSCDATSGATFPVGSTTVTCSATDGAGNRAQAAFTITVGDTTAPDVLVGTTTAEASKPAGADVTYDASAKDTVDGALPVSCTPASGSTFALGATVVSCTAIDSHSNTGTGTGTVTVQDTMPPALSLTGAAVAATGPDGAAATFQAAATDLVDGDVAVQCDASSGSVFPMGTTTVTCTATDAHHNTATGTLQISVQDGTPPTLGLPADRTVEATSAAGAVVSFAATATDAAAGSLPVVCDPASGSTFPLGITTVSCTAVDGAGNSATGTFTVRVVDTTAPVVTVTNAVAEATGPAGAVVRYSASARDAVDGSVPVTCSPASGSTFRLGTTSVTCAAVDRAGNTGGGPFAVTVRDRTAPTLTVPRSVAATATAVSGARVTFRATAVDRTDSAPRVSCAPASGATFRPGATTVSCVATDRYGNRSAAKAFRVSVTYAWSGWLSPSPSGRTVVKAGRVLPVRFALRGASARITTLKASLYYAKVTKGKVGRESRATFRYDRSTRTYLVKLPTRGLSAGTYRLRADTGDGATRTVTVTIKK